MQSKNILKHFVIISYSVSLVNLLGRNVSTSHGDGETFIRKLPLSRHVLASILPLLPGDEAVALHGDGGVALPPVRRRLLELLAQPGERSVSSQPTTVLSYLNFSSTLFMVVLVIMVQLPPVSLMVITGVLAMAAFLNMKPTLSSLRKFSYPASEVRVKVPENNFQSQMEHGAFALLL